MYKRQLQYCGNLRALSLKMASRDGAETSDSNICHNDNYSRPQPNRSDLNFYNYDAGRESLKNRQMPNSRVKTENSLRSFNKSIQSDETRSFMHNRTHITHQVRYYIIFLGSAGIITLNFCSLFCV